jgi:MYXO-CTERM domain-containing protein
VNNDLADPFGDQQNTGCGCTSVGGASPLHGPTLAVGGLALLVMGSRRRRR